MKKLYQNIQTIKIKGKPSDLYEIVTKLDKSIETLANETSEIKRLLFKYIDSNAGKQYEKATTTVHQISKDLSVFAENINDLQHQVCKLVEKSNEYDLRHDRMVAPRKLQIQIVKPPVNIANFEFNKSEMVNLSNKLKKYNTTTLVTCKKIERDKNEIGHIWNDNQYFDFAKEIDQLVSNLEKKVGELNVYANSLDRHIKILDS